MGRVNWLAAAGVLVLCFAPARASDWDITVSPRLQAYYAPAVYDDDDEFDDSAFLYVGALTASIRRKESPYALEVEYYEGTGSGEITAFQGADYDYSIFREEYGARLIYRPKGASNIAFLAGLRSLSFGSDISTIGDPSGQYALGLDTLLYEGGIRLAALASPGSRHAFSSTFALVYGKVDFYERATATSIDRPATPFDIEDKVDAFGVDIALGYNYILSRRMTIGARVRLFAATSTETVTLDDETVSNFASGAPEINLSYKF